MKRDAGHLHAASRRRIGADAPRRSTRRSLLVALGAGALTVPLALPFSSMAQQAGKVWRIGYLDLGSRQSMVDSGRRDALMQGLGGLGYVEGKHFVLEERFAEGNTDRLNDFATELVRQKVDLILTFGALSSHTAKRASATIPIIVTVTSDPVVDGLVASLARPGGNVTGMSNGVEDTVQKVVELLTIAVPKLKRIAVLTNPSNSSHVPILSLLQAAATQTSKQVFPMTVRTPDELKLDFAAMASERTDAVIFLPDAFLLQMRTQIAALALKHRLPSIYPTPQYAEVGGLMSYGGELSDNYRRAGIFVDKILKGAKPGELLIEQPTRYYLVINRKTATALNLNISQELLLRTDEVIE